MNNGREGLLDKIRALLAKTVENGCTEAEMLAALAKARAMRDAHAVTDGELQLAKAEAAILRNEPEDRNDPHKIKWHIALAVAEFCECKVWRNRDGGYTFCGMAADVQWASWLAGAATQSNITNLQAAARTLGLQLFVENARTDGDLEPAFAAFSQRHVDAVLVGNSAFFNRRTEQLAALAARNAFPAMFPLREYAFAGGLLSYGSSLGYMMHQVGMYTGRILKGEKPADLPVMQSTKFELVINLKTAKALNLTIPETLLATADEVIQ
jgi:hypothetical protein